MQYLILNCDFHFSRMIIFVSNIHCFKAWEGVKSINLTDFLIQVVSKEFFLPLSTKRNERGLVIKLPERIGPLIDV